MRTDFDGFSDQATGVVLQPDGKVVVVAHSDGRGDPFALARYNPDGSLDSSFSADGRLTTSWATNSTRSHGMWP